MTEFVVFDGPKATDDVEEFVSFVQKGGAVNEYYVRQGIMRKGAKVVFARVDCTTVGVAALNVPLEAYRNGLDRTFASLPDAALLLQRFCRSCSAQHFSFGQ